MTLFQQPPAQAAPPVQQAPAIPATPPFAATRFDANATLLWREEVTDSMAAFTLALDQPIESFRPGQYLSLGLPSDSGKPVQRPYSVVSLHRPDRVELFIRRVPDGALSPRLWSLPIGARVRVGQPKGLFVLEQDDRRPRLFIGTGTGLAPLLAMLEAVVEGGDDVTSVLIHGVSHRDELAYGYRIASWMATGLPLIYRPTLSRADDERNLGWRGFRGRADAALTRVLDEMPVFRGGVAYLCGNGAMVETCSALLIGAGLRPEDVRAEKFHAPTPSA